MSSLDPPDRNERERCWVARDAYFACLDAASIVLPGRDSTTCKEQKAAFDSQCSKTWVLQICLILECSGSEYRQAEYFVKRRLLEMRQKKTQLEMGIKDGYVDNRPKVEQLKPQPRL